MSSALLHRSGRARRVGGIAGEPANQHSLNRMAQRDGPQSQWPEGAGRLLHLEELGHLRHSHISPICAFKVFSWQVRTLNQRIDDGQWPDRTPAIAVGLTNHVWSLAKWLKSRLLNASKPQGKCHPVTENASITSRNQLTRNAVGSRMTTGDLPDST